MQIEKYFVEIKITHKISSEVDVYKAHVCYGNRELMPPAADMGEVSCSGDAVLEAILAIKQMAAAAFELAQKRGFLINMKFEDIK